MSENGVLGLGRCVCVCEEGGLRGNWGLQCRRLSQWGWRGEEVWVRE